MDKVLPPGREQPNAIVSYYTKGALVALLLDLRLRAGSKGATSLDDLMRALWQRHGLSGLGVAEDGIFALASEIGGAEVGNWLRELVEGTAELPLESVLARAGVSLAWEASGEAPGIGVRTSADGDTLKLANIYDGGSAQAAGLSAGDVLVALDGLKLGAGNFDKLLARRIAGDSVEIHVFRRDELMRFDVALKAAPKDTARLTFTEDAPASALALREGWLKG